MSDDGAPRMANAGGGAEVNVQELAELRELLFGGERRQLDELRRRLDTAEITTEELAEKLPQAIAQRAARDRQLAIALAPTVERAISESVRRNPREFATAIFPVLGPAIRKAIAETMAGLVNTINRAIEHSFTPQGIRWRVESWRTGVSFAQIVMRHSLVYRVEQVFLIHSETGLLLAHVPEDQGENADLISGMLTAISDFVNDSFEAKKTGELRTFAAGDLTVLVESGPQAYVAAVIRGQPPETLPVKLQTTLETIHLQWSNPLASFTGDSSGFSTTRPLLEECVETVLSADRTPTRAGLTRFAWGLAPAVLALAGIAWWAGRGGRQWNDALTRLETEPGIAIIRSERSDGKWHVTGMRDPLSVNPALLIASRGVDTNEVIARWEPYVSTEPALVLERARRVLSPPTTVTLSLSGDTLIASGRAPGLWIVRAEALAPALAGVGAVKLSSVAAGLPAEVEFLARAIERRHALFSAGSDVLDEAALATTVTVAAQFADLITTGRTHQYEAVLEIVGRADTTGTEPDNLSLSRRRALAVRDRLISLGIEPTRLTVSATGADDPLPADTPAEHVRLNRSASFVVRAQQSSRAIGAERVR